MAVQQRRNSKTRKAKRRTHYKLMAPAMVKCASCGEYKLAHRACPNCGAKQFFIEIALMRFFIYFKRGKYEKK